MEKMVYTIKDTKANYYHAPQMFRNRGEILRALSNLVNSDSKDSLSMNPEDYALFEIAKFDEAKGQLIPKDQKDHICDLVDLVEVKDNVRNIS